MEVWGVKSSSFSALHHINDFLSSVSTGVAVWKDRQWIVHSRLSGTVFSRPSFCHGPSKLGLKIPSLLSLSISLSFFFPQKMNVFSINDLLKPSWFIISAHHKTKINIIFNSFFSLSEVYNLCILHSCMFICYIFSSFHHTKMYINQYFKIYTICITH